MRGSVRPVGLLALLAVLLVGLPAQPADAWKPASHLFAGELALMTAQVGSTVPVLDVDGDPSKTVTVQANATIVQALREYPEAYRAGLLGPDAFPDIYFGQAAIHPDTRWGNGTHADFPGDDDAISDEWLAYVWEQAWHPGFTVFANHLPVSDDEQLRNIAFAVGFLGHANGDTWAHTLINHPDIAGGAFPDLTQDADPGDAANFEHGDIAIKHVIVENYIDKHRPGYHPVAPSTYQIDAPSAFVSSTLLLSDFAREHGDHAVLDPLIDRFWQVDHEREELAFDQANQDCWDDTAADCTAVPHQGHTHFVCLQSSCGGDPTDSPMNFVEAGIDAAWLAYMDAWRQDLLDGFTAYVEMSETIARELQTGRKPDPAVIQDAAHDWVLDHLLSMMGYPDFVGDGLLWTSDMTAAVYGFLFSCQGTAWTNAKNDPTFGDLTTGLCDLIGDTKQSIQQAATDIADDLLAGLFTNHLGLDRLEGDAFDAIDLDGDGEIQPLGEALQVIAEPENYIEDPRLFPPGTRTAVDDAMALQPGTDDDANDLFRDYQIDAFAALKNTERMAQLTLLDQHGLNDLFRQKAGQSGNGAGLDDLYGPYVNPHRIQQVPWYVPNNVMLGWNMSLDGDHQWRRRTLYSEDGATFPSYGTGDMWLWEDCVARDRVWRRLFDEPVPGHTAFDESGDPSRNISDDAGPVSTIGLTPDGAHDHTSATGTTYVTGGRGIAVSALDGYFTAGDVDLLYRWHGAAEPIPSVGQHAGNQAYDDFTLGTGTGDGPYIVRAQATDGCGNVGAEAIASYYLDNTAPTVVIDAPAAGVYDTDTQLPVSITVTDAGSGVLEEKVFLDDVLIADGSTLDTWSLGPGEHVVKGYGRDNLLHVTYETVTFRVTATAASLRTNLDRLLAEGAISDPAVYEGLVDKLEQAARAHDRGQHTVEHKALSAFIEQVRAQSGKGIAPDTAALLIAYAEDLIATGG